MNVTGVSPGWPSWSKSSSPSASPSPSWWWAQPWSTPVGAPCVAHTHTQTRVWNCITFFLDLPFMRLILRCHLFSINQSIPPKMNIKRHLKALYTIREGKNQLDPQCKWRATVARKNSPVVRNVDQIQTPEGHHLPISFFLIYWFISRRQCTVYSTPFCGDTASPNISKELGYIRT